ncbi:HpcH/HpaI aldolase family protein [Deinococcus planocerae]|uniref:HpcH/HpaI aldolase family protein n=1 Tax=Deinococcus planocerae TaxID=1737569 RepID=UPI001CA4C21E|nr:aldolase/citrate lyase family protein [Deinococcus planocerae]
MTPPGGRSSLRDRLARGEALLNGWLHVPSPFSAEVMAHAGWDALTLDTQHGPFDFTGAVPMIQAIQTTGTHVLARVPGLDAGLIGKFLDAGAEGVICPVIETRAECEAFVAACRYPPHGSRSFGPTRAALHFGADYGTRADALVVPMPMIETARGLENVDEIAGVPGVGALFVGPGDLSLSLDGEARLDREDKGFLEVLARVVRAAQAHRVAAGIFTASPGYARRMLSLGYTFVTVSSDARLLAAAAGAAIREVRA